MDVIVVGCGASGIAAMRRLRDAGLKVIGLEASHRVGGRIYTRLFGDGVVDVGAAWCHGEKDNIVFEIANPRDLLGRPEPDNKWFIQSNGDLMPNDHCEKILKALNQSVKKADKKGTTSISECVREAVRTNPTLSKECRLSSALADWYERNSHVGGQTNPKLGKSLRGLAEFHNCKGEFMLNWKGKGYKTILDVLMEQEPGKEPLDIRTSKVVHNIKYNSDVGGSPINPFVHVKCNDNSLYAAKSVIVTVSVGVLKEQHTTLFDPPLPPEKVAAINSLELAVLDKIYIEFDAPWWPQTPANFTLLWRDEDKAKFSKEDKWITEIYGLQTVDYRPNVLLAWIYGEGAKQMEAASEATVRLGVEKILEIFNKKFKVTPIKNLIRSKWASNPFVRGAYAYRSVATEEQDVGGAISLSQPVYHSTFPLLCFAGEATSHHHHSAVHGAIEAGFREADRLIEELKKFQEYD